MLDLTLALNDLKHVHQAHIVSVGNECKELLLLLGQGEGVPADDIPIHCVNFTDVPAPQASSSPAGRRRSVHAPTPLN